MAMHEQPMLEQAFEHGPNPADARSSAFAEAALEGIIFHSGGVILDANPQAARMLGYPIEEVIGQNLSYFIAGGADPMLPPRDVVGLKKDGCVFRLRLISRTFSHLGQPAQAILLREAI
jgi:PAS domain-containing protein